MKAISACASGGLTGAHTVHYRRRPTRPNASDPSRSFDQEPVEAQGKPQDSSSGDMVKIGAPPALNSRRWSFWRSLRRLCPCRVRTLSALPAAWRRRASSGRRSFPHRASRVAMAMHRRREHRLGTGPDCWGACLSWIWHPVFRHGGGGSLAPFRLAAATPCASLPPSPRSR